MTDGAQPPTKLPPTIGRPALGALAAEGYIRLVQLTEITRRELLGIHGVGPKAVRILEAELMARGLGFAEARHGPARFTHP